MNASWKTPKEHIYQIREKKFGLTTDGRFINNPLSDDLQHAIQEFSEGLYSKETHFIFELIQNAEDNRYAKKSKPDLTFILVSKDPTRTPKTDGALIIVNNEIGFRPKDVRVLCGVGNSTKEKKEGYVGEKGIGFKSVFVVSNQPHIFSAGYQFRFQEEPDTKAELGYIIPYWVSEKPRSLQEYSGKTCIVLPLKKGKYEKVAKELKFIAKETILFLSKLQGLTIQIEDQKPIEVVRDDSKRPLVQFLEGENFAEFWVSEKTFRVPSDLYEKKRIDINDRRVSVAFPFSDKEKFAKNIFAFLPTEVNSGFPFLINADFILESSRERIQFHREWNQWLRDCLAPTFLEAFKSLLDNQDHRGKAYTFIPLLDDFSEEFFRSSVQSIYDGFRKRPLVWTFNGEDFVLPSDARFASTKFRNLLALEVPKQLQKTPLVHPKINKYRKQLKAVGVKRLSKKEIIECMMDESWLYSQDAEWFVELYKYLSEETWANRENLRDVNLLLLEGGSLSNTTTQPIYFLEEESQIDKSFWNEASKLLNITFLDSGIYELVQDNEEVKRWLNDAIGVHKFTLASYCADLADLLNKRRTEISVNKLINLTAYIRESYFEFPGDVKSRIRQKLPLVLNDGSIVEPRQWDNNKPLVMPEAMDPNTGWQLVFVDAVDRAHMNVLSNDYLDNCPHEIARQEWKDYFNELGATDTPFPREKYWVWRRGEPDDLTSTSREFLKNRRRHSTRWYEIWEWLAPTWLKEFHKADDLVKPRAVALIKWLERQELTSKPRYFLAKYKWYYYKSKSRLFNSEFKQYLLETAWFPSTQGFKRPGEVFLNQPELKEIFGDTLSYAFENPNEKVVDLLGLRQTATRRELLGYLKELSKQPAGHLEKKVVQKIYRFLAERWRPGLKNQFEKNALILVSKPKPKWINAKQAVWPDLADVFGTTYAYLQTEYELKLKHFFVEKIGIATRLEPKLYIQAWSQQVALENQRVKEVEAALEHIYPEALKLAKQVDPPYWWQEFCEDAQVWTQSNSFESARRVYVPDDGELRRVFVDKGVAFAWRPEKASFDEYKPLYRALGVSSLAEEVKTTAEVEQPIENNRLQSLLTPAAKRSICFYLWNSSRNVYEEAKKAGMLESLLSVQEQGVKKIKIFYKLDLHTSSNSSVTYWQQKEKNILYRLEGRQQDKLEIEMPAVIARRVGGGHLSKPLENFIGRVLGASEIKAEGIIHKNNWSLPEEEKKWMSRVLSLEVTSQAATGEAVAGIPREDDLVRTETPEDYKHGRSTGASRTGGDGVVGSKSWGKSPTDSGIVDGCPEPATKRKPRGKLRTYLIPEGHQSDNKTDSDLVRHHSEVDHAGIRRVLEYERNENREPKKMPHHQKGYDIKSLDDLGNVRYIEVKSLSGEWGTRNAAGLTRAQFEMARKHGEKVWLYVVERATTEDYQIYPIQDPANRVNQYLYDDGWRAVSEFSERT